MEAIEINNDIKDLAELSELEEKFKFWITKLDKEGNIASIKIDPKKYIDILYSFGYRRYDVDNGQFVMVQIEDNVIREVSMVNIQDRFVRFIDHLPARLLKHHKITIDVLKSKIYDNPGTYFNEAKFKLLAPKEKIEINEDTITEAFFYFKNGFVRVTADKIQLKKYNQLKKYVWEDMIIDRDFKQGAIDYKFEFMQFLYNVSNRDAERLSSLSTLIGYGLHKFYNYQLKTIVFTDSRISDDPEGRSGKGLTLKSLGYMLNKDITKKIFCEVRGKYFDPEKQFRWQEVDRKSKLVHLNDINNSKYKGFAFERLFNDIDSGLSVECKGETPFPVFCKIFISTNRALRLDGGSALERVVEFEMSDYYDMNHKPEHDFGRWFFRDWKKEDWQKFDIIMLNCVRQFLTDGIILPGQINLSSIKLLQHTHENFVDWINSYRDLENTQRIIVPSEEYIKSELLSNFKEQFPDWDKLTLNRFTKWLKLYAKHAPGIIPFKDIFKSLQQRKAGTNSYIRFLPINYELTDSELVKVKEVVRSKGKKLKDFGIIDNKLSLK